MHECMSCCRSTAEQTELTPSERREVPVCDACEAASKSIKDPTAILIHDLVEKIINGQMSNGQYMNSDITFKEIQTIKKVIKKKLNNIYHLRIEYPE